MKRKNLWKRTLSLTLAMTMVLNFGSLPGNNVQLTAKEVYASEISDVSNADSTQEVLPLQEVETVSDNYIRSEEVGLEANSNGTTGDKTEVKTAANIEEIAPDKGSVLPSENALIADYIEDETLLHIVEGILNENLAASGKSTYQRGQIPMSVLVAYNGVFDFSNEDEVAQITSVAGLGFARNATKFDLGQMTSLTEIKEAEFMSCTGVTEIVLPENIQKIGKNAFFDCTNLAKITVESGASVKENVFPRELIEVGSAAFRNTAITEITLGREGGVSTAFQFADLLFYGSKMERVTIAPVVTVIPNQAFADCKSLNSVTFEANSNLDKISTMAFFGADSLRTVDLTNCTALTAIEEKAFANIEGSTSGISTVILPNALRSPKQTLKWGKGAFERNVALDNVGLKGCEGIVIPSYIDNAVGDGCFTGSVSINSVTFPENWTYVPTEMFSECEALTDVMVKNVENEQIGGLVEIKAGAFRKCELLTDDSIVELITDNKIVAIGDEAFKECKEISTIAFPDTLQSIGAEAFICPQEEINTDLPGESVTHTKAVISELKSIEWLGTASPKTGITRSIGNSAFSGNLKLQSVILPQNKGEFFEIGDYTFADCASLATIKADGIDVEPRLIENVEINQLPNTICHVGEYAFAYCFRLQTLAMDTVVTNKEFEMGDGVFRSANSLTIATLPNNMKSIPKQMFRDTVLVLLYMDGTSANEQGHANVLYSDMLTSIEEEAFYGVQMPKLNMVNCPKLSYIGDYAFAYFKVNTSEMIYEPAYTYVDVEPYYYTITEVVLSDQLANLTLGNDVFRGAIRFQSFGVVGSDLKKNEETYVKGLVYLPDYLSNMGANVFANTAVSDARIPSHMEILQPGTFSATLMKNVDFLVEEKDASGKVIHPLSLTQIGAKSFAYCELLTDVNLYENDKITKIGDHCFRGCPAIISEMPVDGQEVKQFTLPVNIESLGAHAFAGISKVPFTEVKDMDDIYYDFKYLDLSCYSKLTTIGRAAFAGIDSLTEVKLPSNVNKLPDFMFYQDISLYRVDFNRKNLPVESIGVSCFEQCESLAMGKELAQGVNPANEKPELIFGENLTALETSAFAKCYSLGTVVVNEKLTKIGANCFANSGRMLEEVEIAGSKTKPAYMRKCNNSSFAVDFTNGGNIASIGNGAFSRSGLESIDLTKVTGVTKYNNNNGIFTGCALLKDITFPSTVTFIGSATMTCCPSLSSVAVYNTTTMHENAFYGKGTSNDLYYASQADAQSNDVNLKMTNRGMTTGFTLEVLIENEVLAVPLDKVACFPYYIGANAEYDYVAFGNGAQTNYKVSDVILEAYGINAYYLNIKEEQYLLDEAHVGKNYYTTEEIEPLDIEHCDVPVFNVKGIAKAVEPREFVVYCQHTFYLDDKHSLAPASTTHYQVEVVDATYKADLYRKYTSNVLSNKETPNTNIQWQRSLSFIYQDYYYDMSYTNPGLDSSDIVDCNVVVISDNPEVLYPGRQNGDKSCMTTGRYATNVLPTANQNQRKFTLIPAKQGIANVTVYPSAYVGDERFATKFTYIVNADLTAIALKVPTGKNILKPGESTTLGVTVTDAFGKRTELKSMNELSQYTNNVITFTSMDGAYISVDNTGKVTALKADKSQKNVQIKAECTTSMQKTVTAVTSVGVKYPEVVAGKTYEDITTGAEVKVTVKGNGNGQVQYVKAPAGVASTYTIPTKVTINGVVYNVTEIADGAFKNNKTLKKITIPTGITKIGKSAFSGCSNLTTVKIGKSVTDIGTKAFYNCKKLKSLTMGSAVKIIGNSAFQNCSKLTKITIPKNVTEIGSKAFYNCKKLKTITIKSTVLTKVGKQAFKNIYKKATIKVPRSKKENYKTLLKGKGQKKTVKIK